MNYDHPRVKNGLNLDLLGLKQKAEYMQKYEIYLPSYWEEGSFREAKIDLNTMKIEMKIDINTM